MTTPPSRPFSLHIFLPQGDPAGLRIVEKSLWTGCGLVFPRALFPALKSRSEFGRPGVYVLVGPGEAGDNPTIYVGQGEPVRLRLEQQYANKDFWTWAVVFVSKDAWLNTARAQYLEARLLQRARETRRAKLDNQNSPRPPALAVAERADADSFLADILSLLPVLGLTVFESAPGAAAANMLTLRSQKVVAQGYDSSQGFVVASGSQAALTTAPAASAGLISLREELRARGVLVPQGEQLGFAQEYVFSSPSTAAGVVLGREANLRTEWRDAAGRTLRQLQEAESGG
jgi:hypothetical protein